MAKRKSSNQPLMDEKVNGKATRFLERKEIWFKTVVSVLLTIITIVISLFAADRTIREKTPFFMIENVYDSNTNRNIFSLKNTGGDIRNYYVTVSPYLYLYQADIRSIETLQSFFRSAVLKDCRLINDAFIFIPGFYFLQNPSNNSLFAFSDVFLDESIVEKFSKIGGNNNIGSSEWKNKNADEFFAYCVGEKNKIDDPFRWYSQIVYCLDITYTNYKNENKTERYWLTRADYADNLSYLDPNYIENNIDYNIIQIDNSIKARFDCKNDINYRVIGTPYAIEAWSIEEFVETCMYEIDDIVSANSL